MDYQNLWYALTQIAHNFGAVAVVAMPLHAICRGTQRPTKPTLLVTLAGWLIQLSSGALFGLISLYYYGQLPDIHGTAVAALTIKLVCAGLSITLCLFMLRHARLSLPSPNLQWLSLSTLGAVALTAAAVLRWFS